MQKQLRKFYRALLEPKFIIEGLEPKIVRSTFRACVEKMTKQPSFAEDLLAILERKILHTNDYRMQYKITGNLMESKDDDGIKSHFFYDLIQRIQYDAVIETDNKEFLIITDQSIFDRQKASSSIEHRFLVHRNWIFGDDYHSAFDVSEMTIDGVRLKKKIADSDGGVGKISFSVPKKFLDGKQHRVIYVINEKIPKRGHQIFFFARIPCYGYYCELDYSQTDIYHMDYNCMLTSKEIAVVQKIPPEKPFKIAVDVQNSWVLPGGGVFFTWSRLSERRSEYESGGEKYPDDKERIMMNL